MTDAEFMDAMCSLGIELVPSPAPGHDAQYQCSSDPASPKRASVTRTEGQLLASWADCKRVLEIGTGLGVSTVCLAHSAIEVVTVDPDEWVHENVRLPSAVVRLRSIDEVDGEFDMAFVDGLHGYDEVKSDIVRCLSLVPAGGTIAFHDITQADVEKAVQEFPWAWWRQEGTIGLLTLCGVPV